MGVKPSSPPPITTPALTSLKTTKKTLRALRLRERKYRKYAPVRSSVPRYKINIDNLEQIFYNIIERIHLRTLYQLISESFQLHDLHPLPTRHLLLFILRGTKKRIPPKDWNQKQAMKQYNTIETTPSISSPFVF